jgi:hypothetical protein
MRERDILIETIEPIYRDLVALKTVNAEHLNACFAGLSPSRVTAISEDMESVFSRLVSRSPNGWSTWSPAADKQTNSRSVLKRDPRTAPLLSVSWNGYVREEALKHWGPVESPFELALLIARLNDWVAPVRHAAQEKLSQFIQLGPEGGITPEHVLGCMDLILKPSRFGRMEPVGFAILESLLEVPGGGLAFNAFVLTDRSDAAPRLLKLALSRGHLTDILTDLATTGHHPETRRVAVKTLLSGNFAIKQGKVWVKHAVGVEVDKVQLAKAAMMDSSANVKKEALDFILAEKPAELYTVDVFEAFATSRKGTLQDRAIFGLETLGQTPIDDVRRSIGEGKPSEAALDTLARYGTSKDNALVYEYAISLSGQARTSALCVATALGHAAAAREVETIMFKVQDDVEALKMTRALRKGDFTIDFERAIDAVRSEVNIETRGLIGLIRTLPTFQLALVIAEMELSEREFRDLKSSPYDWDNNSLWSMLLKKRNRGAFVVDDVMVERLQRRLIWAPSVKEKFSRLLGIAI